MASSDDGTAETVSVTVTLSDSGAGSLTADSGEGENYDSSTGIWSISEVSEETATRHWQRWHLSLRPTKMWTSQRM